MKNNPTKYFKQCMKYNLIKTNSKKFAFYNTLFSLARPKTFNRKLMSHLNTFYRFDKLSFSTQKENEEKVFINKLNDQDLESISQDKIRNFCIIAHIDHGKSTLSDRILETCGVIEKVKKENAQVLDNLQVEKERGITVKAQTASMIYKGHLLNLIDTPGHVDFSFEVIRSLKPCQGAILLVDATKGVQAQTVANFNHAKKLGIHIIPVINKIDLPGADVLDTELQIFNTFGFQKCSKISAKIGVGITDLLEQILIELPAPKGDQKSKVKLLLYDAKYVEGKGVIIYVEVLDGEIKKGDTIVSYHNDKAYDVFEVGVVQPTMTRTSKLRTGQVGYISSNLKEIKEAKIGDTLFHKSYKKSEIQADLYEEPKSMVFSGVYPTDPSCYTDLKKGIEKLSLNDPSIKVDTEMSASLGAGFRIGFLGLLHLDVFHQRLEDEYDLDVILTPPSTTYLIYIKKGIKNLEVTYPNVKIKDKDKFEKERILYVENLISCPDREVIESIHEPYIEAEIITPKEYINSIKELVLNKRGEEIFFEEQGELIKSVFEIPLNEIVIDFYDKVKSISKGYASFDYKISSYKKSDIKFVNFLVHGQQIDVLGFFAHSSNCETQARKVCAKLKKYLPQQLFSFAIQAKVENKIICREDIKALRKNVIARCYGGDYTRKKKLLDGQKKGKKKLREFGSVRFSSDTFYNLLKDNDDN